MKEDISVTLWRKRLHNAKKLVLLQIVLLKCMPHSRWNIEYIFLPLPRLVESNFWNVRPFLAAHAAK